MADDNAAVQTDGQTDSTPAAVDDGQQTATEAAQQTGGDAAGQTDQPGAEGQQPETPDNSSLVARLDKILNPAPVAAKPKDDQPAAWNDLAAPELKLDIPALTAQLGEAGVAALQPLIDQVQQLGAIVKAINGLGPKVHGMDGWREQMDGFRADSYDRQTHSLFDEMAAGNPALLTRYGKSQRAATPAQKQSRTDDHTNAVKIQRAFIAAGDQLSADEAFELARMHSDHGTTQPQAVRRVQAQVSRASRRITTPPGGGGGKGGDAGKNLSPAAAMLERSKNWRPPSQE